MTSVWTRKETPLDPAHTDLPAPAHNRPRLSLAVVTAAVEQLPPADRDLIRAIEHERLSYAETGALLGISKSAVAARRTRALTRLAAHIPPPNVLRIIDLLDLEGVPVQAGWRHARSMLRRAGWSARQADLVAALKLRRGLFPLSPLPHGPDFRPVTSPSFPRSPRSDR